MMDNIVLFLAEHPGWVALFILGIQLIPFIKALKKFCEVNFIFSKDIRYAKKETDLAGISIITIRKNGKMTSPLLKTLINELNDYIRKNEGTTDFSIIQHKTERLIKNKFENATARLSFPIYLGLMGTFLGILIGLSCFNIPDGNTLVTDAKIEKLIHGVLISMSTSLTGLLLTTVLNGVAAYVKNNLDIEKNRFYEFIQNELMPELGTSMVSALSKLRSTINKFEPAFNKVIDRFQQTFDECTSSFGEAFRENVQVVANAVSSMGDNIALINTNVANQQKLLDALKSSSMNRTLDKFISTTDRFDSLADSMSLLNQIKEETVLATHELIKVQKDYNASLSIPLNVAEKLHSILDRVTEFENSINLLGERLGKEQMIGNSVINQINSQLDAIKQKNDIAINYTSTANEELESLYKKQVQVIKNLSNDYSRAISDHAEEFEEMLKQINKLLNEKWGLFVNALDDSFNLSEVSTDFVHLKKLDVIATQLASIQQPIEENSSLVEEVKKLARSIEERDIVPVPPSELKESNSEVEEVPVTSLSSEQLKIIERKLDEIDRKLSSSALMEENLKEMAESIDSKEMQKTILPRTNDATETEDDEVISKYQNLLEVEKQKVRQLNNQLESIKSELGKERKIRTQYDERIAKLENNIESKESLIHELEDALQQKKNGTILHKLWPF